MRLTAAEEGRDGGGGRALGSWLPGSGLDAGQAVLEGALGAVAALLAAAGEAGHLLSDVGTGEGARLWTQALPVQTPGRAACVCSKT